MVETSYKIINCLFDLTFDVNIFHADSITRVTFTVHWNTDCHLKCSLSWILFFSLWKETGRSSPGSPAQTALPPLLIVPLPFVNPTVVRKNAVYHIFNLIHLSSAVSKTLHICVYLRENNGRSCCIHWRGKQKYQVTNVGVKKWNCHICYFYVLLNLWIKLNTKHTNKIQNHLCKQ